MTVNSISQLSSDNRLQNVTHRLKRLRMFSIGLFLLLMIPLTTLVYVGYSQLKSEVLGTYQKEALNLVEVTNRNLFKRRLLTNTLAPDAFGYYQQVYNPLTGQSEQTLSPLSQLTYEQPKIAQQVRGLVGFFQYDAKRRFSSPLWPQIIAPDGAELSAAQQADPELRQRYNTAHQIHQIVSASESIQSMLNGEYDDEKLLFGVIFDIPDYFIFYRIVTVSEQKHMQGYLIERKPYLSQLFTYLLEERQFDGPVLVKLEDVSHSGESEYFLYQKSPAGEVSVTQPQHPEQRFMQQPVSETTLRWPYDGYSLRVTTSDIPLTSAMVYGGTFVSVLILAILVACYGFYRLGVRQLMLAEQRLNFVSSVSHELKTPLTSIRMYSEMLRDGMVMSEESKQDYYAFIYTESERLSRLINNILQLSSLSNHKENVQPQFISLDTLQDIIRSKTSSLIEKHRFTQNIVSDSDKDWQLLVDQDAFAQIVINITDNAIKFFDHDNIDDPERRRIDYVFRQSEQFPQHLEMEIRDYGEGISKAQESKIFELFYRGENELTRTTQGTGIGLSLVNELVLAQKGQIRVERKTPGLSMFISFQARSN